MVSSEEEKEEVTQDGGDTEVVLDLSGCKLSKLEKAPSNRAFATALVLDDNYLQNLTNLDSYGELQRISLSNNKVVRMYWFARMYSLRILNLPGNNIVNIEGLKELHHLVHLNLAANNIKNMDGVSQCHKLQHLNLSGNSITSIADLTPLHNLKELFLHRNRMNCLTRCSKYLPASLVILTLSDNLISDLNHLCHLSNLTNLEQFTILNNPCLQPFQPLDEKNIPTGPPVAFDYRPFVINWCLNLKVLDGYKVTPMESLKGEWLYSQGRGRGFQQGEHGPLVQYLSGICLAGGGWGGAALPQHDLKLVKILQLAKQHQQDLRRGEGVGGGDDVISSGCRPAGVPVSVSQHSSPAAQRRGLHARPPPHHRRHTAPTRICPDRRVSRTALYQQQQQQLQQQQQQQQQYHVELSSTLYGGGLKTPDTPCGLMTQSMDPSMLLGPLSSDTDIVAAPSDSSSLGGFRQSSAMTRSLGPELLQDALNPRMAPCRSQQLHASIPSAVTLIDAPEHVQQQQHPPQYQQQTHMQRTIAAFPANMTQSLGPEQLAQQLQLSQDVPPSVMAVNMTQSYSTEAAASSRSFGNRINDVGNRAAELSNRGIFSHTGSYTDANASSATNGDNCSNGRRQTYCLVNGDSECHQQQQRYGSSSTGGGEGGMAALTNGTGVDLQARPTCLFAAEAGYHGELDDCSQLSGSSTFVPGPEGVLSPPDQRPSTSARAAGPNYGDNNGLGYQQQQQQQSRGVSSCVRPTQQHYAVTATGHHQSSHQRSHHQQSQLSISAHQASHQAAETRQQESSALGASTTGRGGSRGGGAGQPRQAHRQGSGGGGYRSTPFPAVSSPKLGSTRARTSGLKSPAVVGESSRTPVATFRAQTAASPKPSRYNRGGAHNAGGTTECSPRSRQSAPPDHSPGCSDSDNTDSEVSVSKLQTIKTIAAERRMSERGRDTTPPRHQHRGQSSSRSLQSPYGVAPDGGQQGGTRPGAQPYNPDKYRPGGEGRGVTPRSGEGSSSRSNSATRNSGRRGCGSVPVSRQTTFTCEDEDETAAAVLLQRCWRGYIARHRHPRAVAVRAELRHARAEDHIRALQAKLQRAEEALDRERRLRHLQLEAIRALWRQVGRLQAGRTTPASTPASTPLTPSTPMDMLSCKGGGAKRPSQATEDTVKELTQFCDQLQGQVVSLQDSLSMVSQVMNAFCQLPGSQALLLSQSASCSPMHSLSMSSTSNIGGAALSTATDATTLEVPGECDSGSAERPATARVNRGGGVAAMSANTGLSESLSSLTSSISALTSNIVASATGGACCSVGGCSDNVQNIGSCKDNTGREMNVTNVGEANSAAHDVSTLSHDVSTMSHDVSTMSHDVSTMSQDVSTMSQDMSTLSQDDPAGADLSESSQSSMSGGSHSAGAASASNIVGRQSDVGSSMSSCSTSQSGPPRPSSLPVCRDVTQHR